MKGRKKIRGRVQKAGNRSKSGDSRPSMSSGGEFRVHEFRIPSCDSVCAYECSTPATRVQRLPTCCAAWPFFLIETKSKGFSL